MVERSSRAKADVAGSDKDNSVYDSKEVQRLKDLLLQRDNEISILYLAASQLPRWTCKDVKTPIKDNIDVLIHTVQINT